MNDLIPLLEQLIACPSLTPNDAGCQKIISERLTQRGFHCEFMSFEDVDNLWARYGQKTPLVVFAGHTDVVPTGPLSDWQSQPFKPTVREEFLYGRGAADMKGALAAMIIAAENFVRENANFSGSLAFLITSDEEGPAINGTRKVLDALKARGEKIDYCVIGEPSSINEAGDQIRIGRRGSFHGKLVIHGKQGHVAHPHLAINPIHQAVLALHELAETVWDKGNENFPPTTFQITNIHGGTGATNVIPGHLEVLFNFRFSTAVTVQELAARTEAILNKHHLKYDIEWMLGGEPFLTRKGKLIDATQQAIKKIVGLDTKLSTGGGTSDGRFIAPTGAEVVELGTLHATAHHVNENVKIEDVRKLAAIYNQLLTILLR